MDNDMPQETLTFMQRIAEYGFTGYIWLFVVSVWAGTAKYLGSLNGKPPAFFAWLSEVVISGFVGIIAAMTCQYYQLDFLLTSAITGICAHNGTKSLYLIGDLLKKNTPIDNHPIEKMPAMKLSSKKGERKWHKL